MKTLLLVSLLFFSICSKGEFLSSSYETYGQLLLTNLNCAPFPHPDRKKGHAYKKEFFTGEINYSDNTVAIFIPKQFKQTSRADVVVHFHGWRNSVTNALRQYQLIEQFAASGRNAILVVPQGPLLAADSFGGKLEDTGGFDRFIEEVFDTLQEHADLKNIKPGNIILSGHSGGYHVMSAIVAQTNQFPIREVWLFDALYGETEKFVSWFERDPKTRLLNIYTENGGTKKETENLMAAFKAKQTSFIAGMNKDLSGDVLRTNRLTFIFTDLAHDEVLQKRKTFQTFLMSSVISNR